MTSVRSESWWTRLFGRRRRRDELPQVGEDGLLMDPAEPGGSDGEPSSERPTGLARWSKRDQTLAKLQEGYERVTQVVEEVQKHLAMQGDRTERICTSLEQLARTMGDLPATSRQQVETLQAIAGQLESTGARTQQLTEIVGELPKAARVQGEALNGIKRQLDMTAEQNLVHTQTMEKLGGGIGTLGEFNQAQAQALRDMSALTTEHNQQLSRLIAKQGKRFVALFIVTVVLAAAVIAGVILALAFSR